MRTAGVTTVALPDHPEALAAVRSDDADTWTFKPMDHAGAGAPLGRHDRLTTAAAYPDALLDARLAFYPAVYADCAWLALVRQAIGEAEQLDLSTRLPVG